jgi:exonuclease VII small subunit
VSEFEFDPNVDYAFDENGEMFAVEEPADPAFETEPEQYLPASYVMPASLPQDTSSYEAALEQFRTVAHLLDNSPGAQAHRLQAEAAEAKANYETNRDKINHISATSVKQGDRPLDSLYDGARALQTAEELYRTGLAAGDSDAEANRFAIEQAAKEANGTRTYKDVTDSFRKKAHGKTIVPQRKGS